MTLSGTYAFISQALAPLNWDNFTVLYQGTFNAAAPLANVLIGNDDFATNSFGSSGFVNSPTAGTSYIFVSTGFANANSGDFSNSIIAPAWCSSPARSPATDSKTASSPGRRHGPRSTPHQRPTPSFSKPFHACHRSLRPWCRSPGSNRDGYLYPEDFKSPASAISPLRRGGERPSFGRVTLLREEAVVGCGGNGRRSLTHHDRA